LTINEKDLADLALVGLASYLKDKLDGHEFMEVNQVLQRVVVYKNRVKDSRAYDRFKDGGSREKDKYTVNYVDDESTSDGDTEVCIAKWVDAPSHKPISCSFMKPNSGRKDEMKYIFDVTKCDRLFDVLIQGGVIKLKEGHDIPSLEIIGKRKYCKWHDLYSHTTNECNYFHQQVQSALNDGRLMFSDNRL
jgi:hypothetical protein